MPIPPSQALITRLEEHLSSAGSSAAACSPQVGMRPCTALCLPGDPAHGS